MPDATPLFQKVLPDGSVLFGFDGHVHAEGIDLDAGESDTPPDDSRVRWLRGGGSTLGSIFGTSYSELGKGVIRLSIDLPSSGIGSQAGSLSLQRRPGFSEVPLTSVIATAGNYGRSIINDKGESAFLQLLNGDDLAIQLGFFSFTGSGVQGTNTIGGLSSFSDLILAAFLIPFNGINLVAVSTGAYDVDSFNIVWRWVDGISRTAGISGAFLAIGPKA